VNQQRSRSEQKQPQNIQRFLFGGKDSFHSLVGTATCRKDRRCKKAVFNFATSQHRKSVFLVIFYLAPKPFGCKALTFLATFAPTA